MKQQRWTAIFFPTICLLAIVFLVPAALAQTSASTGAIAGTVTDPTGAVVPNATVKLSNSSIGLSRATNTLSDGNYAFPLLQAAKGYEITVEMTGFQRATLKDIEVQITQVTAANIRLVVGGITQTVEVRGVAEVVQSSNATLGEVMTSEVITSLPLATRNTFELLATDAGVAANLTSPASTILQGNVAMFVAGSRDTANNYTLNGVDANNHEFHTLALGVVPIPNPDAVEQFRTQTSVYDATSGFAGGGNISLITKGGTNSFHGGVYENFRNTIFNANDFFLNRQGKPRPVMQQNQFGASFGGPAGNKRFFFANYEGMRQNNGVAGFGSGTFPVLPASRDAASLAAAFQVPASAIDPVALKLINAKGAYDGYLMPSGSGAPVGTLGTWAFSAPAHLTSNQVSTRFDQDLNLWGISQRLTVTYFFSKGKFINYGGANNGAGQPYYYPMRNDNATIKATQILRPNLLNEFVIGYTYNIRDIYALDPVVPKDLGMYRSDEGSVRALSSWYFMDQSSCCGPLAAVEQKQHNMSDDLRDMLSWIHGKHNIRTGAELRHYQFNFQPSPGRGSLYFVNYAANAQYGVPTGAGRDLSFRDFLIGAPYYASFNSVIRNVYFRAYDVNAFIQDDFRLTRRLTLNLGLRWDFMANTTEKYNHMSNIDLSLLDADTRTYGGPGLRNAFVQAGTPGVNDSTLFDKGRSNFSPRVGFAWDVLGNGTLAFRGGYGIYFQRLAGMQSMQTISNIPNSASATNYYSLYDRTVHNLLADPFAHLPQDTAFPVWPTSWPRLQSINATTGVPSFSTAQIGGSAIDRNLKPPYKQSWNFALQYEFLKGWTVELGYSGSHALRLESYQYKNAALLRNANNPGPFGLSTNSNANLQSRCAQAEGFSCTGLATFGAPGSATYNALLLTISHKVGHGLFFKAAYTFSKSLDNTFTSVGFQPGSSSPGNQFVADLNKGLSSFNMPQRLVVTYVYKLPGPRQGLAKSVLGGWSVSGITYFQSGLPGYISQSGYSLQGTSGYGRILPNCQLTLGVNKSTLKYLDPACVAPMPTMTAGTTFGPLSPYETPGDQMYTITNATGAYGMLQGYSNRGVWRAPFQQRWDMTLAKSFPVPKLGEAAALQLKIEVFKLFNNAIFSGPGTTYAYTPMSTLFGVITGTIDNTGRQMQVDLRLNF